MFLDFSGWLLQNNIKIFFQERLSMADKKIVESQDLPALPPNKTKKKALNRNERLKKIREDFELRGILPNLTPKRRHFLRLYLDINDKKHFFNALQSVQTAFNPRSHASARSMAWEYSEMLRPWIEQYLNDLQFTDEYIKSRVLTLMNAKKTKFFSYQGQVTAQREVEALDVQLKACVLASEIKGMKRTKDTPPQAVFNINFGDMEVSFSGSE
jgi:hypothetical protein